MASETQTTDKPDARGSRRKIVGVVSSTKMQKTVVVTVIRRVRDRRFHKFVVNRVHYKAHDENKTCGLGDTVEIIESRPYSKTKKWRVLRIVEKSKEVAS